LHAATGVGDLTGIMIVWVIEVISRLGYVGLVVLIALETVFPPIPSEVILPLAGFLTGQGRLSYVGAVAAATLGSLLGGMAFYMLGQAVGEYRLRQFFKRFGRWILLNEQDVDAAHAWFEQYGALAVLLGRLVPGVRSYVSIPAGLARMSVLRFVLLTALGSAIWNGVLIGLGWWVGDRWEQVGHYVESLGQLVPLVIVPLLVYFGWRRIRGRLAATEDSAH
jgi:membrane protein DedA with SNARE-associated domain